MDQKTSIWRKFQENLAQRKKKRLNAQLLQLMFDKSVNAPSPKDLFLKAKSLIEQGADVNLQASTSDKKASLLIRAIDLHNHDLIQYLLEKGADVNLPNQDGMTPLRLAVTSDETIVPKILEKGANIDSQDKQGISPLMMAVKNDSHKLVSYLLAKGANPNLTDHHQKSALFYAGSNPRIAQTLLKKGANPKQESLSKTTPLFSAQHPKVFELLLTCGADVNHRDLNRRTPLMVSSNRPEIVQILLQHGADVNLKDSCHDTALHFAQNPQSISLLVMAGADFNAEGFGDETPLVRLAANPYTTPETLQALLQYGPKPFSKAVKNPSLQCENLYQDKNWTPNNLSIWTYTRNPQLKQILMDYEQKWERGLIRPFRSKQKSTQKRVRVSFTTNKVALSVHSKSKPRY